MENETTMPEAKPLNQLEQQEMKTMRQQVDGLRFKIGLHEEKIVELQSDKSACVQALMQQKEAIRARIVNIAKSYGVELNTTKDDVTWVYDESTFSFVALSSKK